LFHAPLLFYAFPLVNKFPSTTNQTKPMKLTPNKTVTQSTCLPPEAYIHLWNVAAAASVSDLPKIKSTVYPDSNIKSIPFKK